MVEGGRGREGKKSAVRASQPPIWRARYILPMATVDTKGTTTTTMSRTWVKAKRRGWNAGSSGS